MFRQARGAFPALAIAFWAAAGGACVAAHAATPTIRFNRDVRAIMSDTCFRCHGPDKGARQGGFRLDIREEALKPNKSGNIPIVPGDPEKSAIIQRIFQPNPARRMPPPFAHKDLTEAQKQTLRRWVAEGAQYERHWSYDPVRRPAVPEIAGAKAPIRNPIDAFIQERLTREGLAPSPEADRRTLLRRVTLDLTGLPPTPDEVRAFVSDTAPEAYDKVVDRLLASTRFAEVQAMYWLDAVRYADSAGFHGDNLWPAWPYRDYVLRAFHSNKPFDEFTREQIAGDLLLSATREQLVASAYNRLNRASAEGGLQPKEYLAKYGADRVRTTSTVWLGATMGCAECHDHRFDPYSSKDFYAMKAFFADIKETGLVSDRGARAWGSKLMLASDEQQARLSDFDERIEASRRTLKEKIQAMDERRFAWEAAILKAHEAGKLAWKYQRPQSATAANGTTLKIYNEELVDFNFYLRGSLASERKPGGGLIIASGPSPDREVYTVELKPGAGTWTAVAIDIHQDESLPGNRLARGADRFLIGEAEVEVDGGRVPLVLATTNGFGEWPENPAMAAIDGDPNTGWGQGFGEHRNAVIALRFGSTVTTTADSTVTLRIRQETALRRATIGRFRVALSLAEHSWPELGESGAKDRKAKALKDESVAILNVSAEDGILPDVLKAIATDEPDRNDAQKQMVADHFAWSVLELQDSTVQLAKLEAERSMFDASIPRVLITERIRPRVTRILPRGNFLNETGEVVEPAIPAFFGKLDSGGRATRLDLANWIVTPENPLTARVFVNRQWRQFFGTGLSKVLEDLGSQGELPTHPELLDWLAAEFMKPEWKPEGTHAWDVKHIVRTIVTSHTYRQASSGSPQVEEKDPYNRLLARQSRVRVNAETVRDIALATADLLVDKFGGPSVKPVEPEGYLAAMNFPKREYAASYGEDLYRRGVYVQWLRTFLHPSLITFDAPTREECTVNRTTSNTPLQALVLLNDPIYVEAARVLAQHMMTEGGKNFDQRLDWAFAKALSRSPIKEERTTLAGLYKKAVMQFKARPTEAAQFVGAGEAPVPADLDKTELAATATVARAILNLHEMITRN
jgi:hypothetical protein